MLVDRGRFGPYVKVLKKYYSIKEIDPYTITKEQALKVIKDKKEADAKKEIKTFEGEDIQILDGRYGPYVKDSKNKKNARIPKETDPKTLTLEQCKELLEKAPAKKRRPRKKKE